MATEDFMGVLILGMMIGSALTVLVQLYGRRKAREAIKRTDLDASRQVELLTRLGDSQVAQIDRLQERLAVLERLAVDPAHRTAREIELLR